MTKALFWKFKNCSEKLDVANKVIIFGGWKPYKNLKDIQMFDMKDNSIVDITEWLSKFRDETGSLFLNS